MPVFNPPGFSQAGSYLVTSNPYSNLACDGVTDDATALNALYAAIPNYSTLVWPPGTMCLGSAVTIPANKRTNHVGAGFNKTYFKSITTGQAVDMLILGDDENYFSGITFTSATTLTTGGAQALPVATLNVADTSLFAASGTVQVQTTANGWQPVAYTGKSGTTLTGCSGGTGSAPLGAVVINKSAGYHVNGGTRVNIFYSMCGFAYYFNGVLNNGSVNQFQECLFSNGVNFGIQFNGSVVNATLNGCVFDGIPAATAHIEVNQCGSLLLTNCDLIRATNCLRINPTSPNGAFGIYCDNCYFDTPTNGATTSGSAVKLMGTGNIQRVKFSNCWFGGGVNGLEFASTAGTLPTAIDLNNCDFYTFSANGILAPGTGVQDWSISGSRIAGCSTAGINCTGAATHRVSIIGNRIGPTGGIGVNAVGIILGAGAAAYGAVIIQGNDCNGNTSNITDSRTAPTTTAGGGQRICNNYGINPRSTSVAPAVPASAALAYNTSGYPVMAYIKGGTLTVINHNGIATGQTVAETTNMVLPIHLEPGDTLAITYTVAPTWVWISQ